VESSPAAAESWWLTPVDPAHEFLRRTTSAEDAPGISDARRRLTHWARDAGISTDTVEDIALAGYEALTNAAEHAYASVGGHGDVDLSAGFLMGGLVRVTVRDHGCWLTPDDPGYRGRGLMMMEGLTDCTGFEIADSGTVVHLGWNVVRTEARFGR
jgi:serine/threonine-protein kinase RsbW